MLTEALTDFRELNPKMSNVVPSELVPLGELLNRMHRQRGPFLRFNHGRALLAGSPRPHRAPEHRHAIDVEGSTTIELSYGLRGAEVASIPTRGRNYITDTSHSVTISR
jgi:hypothetical protein